jgi:CyaY protein
MEEKDYRQLVDRTLRRIDDAFADVDPDLAECNVAQGALSLVFRDGSKAIVSPQPPVQQMWLAYRDRAWHFDYDAPNDRWLDDRGLGIDLYQQLVEITRANAGIALTIP